MNVPEILMEIFDCGPHGVVTQALPTRITYTVRVPNHNPSVRLCVSKDRPKQASRFLAAHGRHFGLIWGDRPNVEEVVAVGIFRASVPPFRHRLAHELTLEHGVTAAVCGRDELIAQISLILFELEEEQRARNVAEIQRKEKDV